MSKYKPPIPKKMELYTTESPYLTRQQWQPFIQDRIRAFKKALRENGSDQRLGMTDTMVKRRTETLLDSIAFIQKRYGDLPGFDPKVSNTLGYCWIHLNYIASQSYNKLARDSYITQAAALWILDQIAAIPGRIRDIHQYLPHDKDVLDAQEWPPIWSPAYDYDLIQSVTYVMEKRNQDISSIEIDPARCRRVTTSELTAKRKHYGEAASRKNYEGLLSLIPQEKIDSALLHFEEAFWKWTDRYFRCLSVMENKKAAILVKANVAVEEYNQLRESLISTLQRDSKPSIPPKPKVSPLVMQPLPPVQTIPSPEDFLNNYSVLNMPGEIKTNDLSFMTSLKARKDPSTDQALILANKMDAAANRSEKIDMELNDLVDQMSMFTFNMSLNGCMDKEYCARECGDDVAAFMEDLHIDDPFELCFALLYLIDDPKQLSKTSTADRIDPMIFPGYMALEPVLCGPL